MSVDSKHKPKAMIWTEAVTASGHIRVTNKLSHALQEKGFEVVIVTSGHAADMVRKYGGFGDAELVDLPSLKPKNNYDPDRPNSFFETVTPSGKSYHEDPAFIKERLSLLKETFDRVKPDVFIAEHWPIGRRRYDPEMLPLMKHIKATNASEKGHNTRLVAYMRDATGLPEMKASPEEVQHILDTYFDNVIVQGQEDIISLDETLGIIGPNLSHKLTYAGYPLKGEKEKREQHPDFQNEVIVSIGGGNQAGAVAFYEQALRARKFSDLSDNKWHVYVNIGCSDEEFAYINHVADEVGGRCIVERENASFVEHMRYASLAIIRGGITVAETAAMGRPAVVVPRAVAPEPLEQSEQYIRTKAFSEKCPNIVLATQQQMSNPELFASLINQAYANRDVKLPHIQQEGYVPAANIISHICYQGNLSEVAAVQGHSPIR
jgi:predicted glycosyltransferase